MATERPFEGIGKALAKRGESLTPYIGRITDLVATSSFSEKRIERFIRRHDIPVEVAFEYLDIASDYGASVSKVDLFVDVGYTPEQLERLLDLRAEVEPKDLSPRRVVLNGESTFWPPQLKNFISYENLLFLDEVTGDHHDSELIAGAIEEIGERLGIVEDRDRYHAGVGVAIYRAKEIYESAAEQGIPITFNTALNRALAHIPQEETTESQGQEKDLASRLRDLGIDGVV